MPEIPAQFVFTDLAAANAEVSRLYRAVAYSGVAICDLIDLVSDDLMPAAARVNNVLCERLDTLTAERNEAEQ